VCSPDPGSLRSPTLPFQGRVGLSSTGAKRDTVPFQGNVGASTLTDAVPTMNRFSLLFGRLFHALAIVAALLLFAMVIVVTADILLRNLVGRGFVWANEVSEYTLYLMTLLAAPWLLRRGQHVRIDLVLTMLPPRAAWLLEALGDLLGFAVCLVLIRYAAAMTLDSWRIGAITIKNLVFPEWWLLAPLPAAFVLLAIEFVFRFDRLLRSERTRRSEATSVG
jgi:TRAP-type C4-dicarboxylate transport system permease small subunit